MLQKGGTGVRIASYIREREAAYYDMKKISRPSVAPLAQDPNSSFNSGQVASSPLRAGYPVREVAYEETQIPARYPQRLSLFLQAPDYEISIEDFESLALSRLESKRIALLESFLTRF